MFYLKRAIFVFFVSLLAAACGLVNSQEINSGNRNAASSANETTRTEANKNAAGSTNPAPDEYEIARAGAEKLNAEPLPPGSKYRTTKPLAREQIRAALIRDDLAGESTDGKIGGGKIAHFSHACDLFVDNQPFRVVRVSIFIQLASMARRTNRVLIYDDALRLRHNLAIDDQPLFCDGNRLFFGDYQTTVFYGEPEKQIKGNVLVFSNAARDIEGRVAAINFYRFADLIH